MTIALDTEQHSTGILVNISTEQRRNVMTTHKTTCKIENRAKPLNITKQGGAYPD